MIGLRVLAGRAENLLLSAQLESLDGDLQTDWWDGDYLNFHTPRFGCQGYPDAPCTR